MPSSHLILCHPLLLLPPIPPSIRVFANESNLCMKWPKYWNFSFSIILSKEIPELISFRTDWLDLLAVQGTLKSLLQQHSSKASILQRSAFFTVQFSHPYITTGKTIALTRWTFVGKLKKCLNDKVLEAENFKKRVRKKTKWVSLVAQLVKNPPATRETMGSFPGLGRSPGDGKGYPLQYSGLEDSMYGSGGREEWDTTVRLSPSLPACKYWW